MSECGWNKPCTKRTTPRLKRGARWLYLWVSVLFVAIVIYLICGIGAEVPTDNVIPSSSQREIPDVATHHEKPSSENIPIDPTYRPSKVFEKANGYVMLPSGRLHKLSQNVLTNDVASLHPKSDFAIFDHHVENQIAALITLNPGDVLVGTPHYGDAFVKKFLKSLENPIIISRDDDEYAKQLKQAVINAKIDLKERYDRGEDIAEIMNDTHNEYQKLAQTKNYICTELEKIQSNPDATSSDIEDFIQAANIILEQKGIAPLSISPVTKQMLLLKAKQPSSTLN